MAHRRAPEVDRELDDIWYYITTQSGSIQIAQVLPDRRESTYGAASRR